MAKRTEFARVMIKGSITGPAKQWMLRAYGRELVNRAVNSLSKEDQEIVLGDMVGVGWYPHASWSAFLTAMRREVTAATGEDGAVFDRRNVFEGGQVSLTKVYRLVLGFFDPTTIIGKITPIFRRVYSHGKLEWTENTHGRCTLRFYDAPLEMLEEVKRLVPLGVELMLDLAGQEVTSTRFAHELGAETFSLDIMMTYRKRIS